MLKQRCVSTGVAMLDFVQKTFKIAYKYRTITYRSYKLFLRFGHIRIFETNYSYQIVQLPVQEFLIQFILILPKNINIIHNYSFSIRSQLMDTKTYNFMYKETYLITLRTTFKMSYRLSLSFWIVEQRISCSMAFVIQQVFYFSYR